MGTLGLRRNTILRSAADNCSLDLRSGLGVGLRCCTYFVSCRRRAVAASPALRPRYHLNITWDAAVCRRLYFYTTEIICGQSQARCLSGDVMVRARLLGTGTQHWERDVSAEWRPRREWRAERARRPPGRAPPAPCTMHRCTASTWLRRDNASTEARSHYTHQIHKCGARCNSLTPILHCQLFIMIYLRMYQANSASISQHN